MISRKTPNRALLLLGALMLCAFIRPQATYADPEEVKNVQVIEKLPLNLPSLDLSKRQKYNQLLTNGRAFEAFRKALAVRIIPIRARVTPKPPFDPRFPSWFHGCAFAFQHKEERGWAMPTALIKDADLLEYREKDGTWKTVKLPPLCEGAELVLLKEVGLALPEIEEDPFGVQSPLKAATKAQIEVNLPLFALGNLEGAQPTLDHGKVQERGKGALEKGWTTALKLPAGTPLLDADGKVLLVRIVRGNASYELTPDIAFQCTKEEDPE